MSKFVKVPLEDGMVLGAIIMVTLDNGVAINGVVTSIDSSTSSAYVSPIDDDILEIKQFFEKYKVTLMKNKLKGHQFSVVGQEFSYKVDVVGDEVTINYRT